MYPHRCALVIWIGFALAPWALADNPSHQFSDDVVVEAAMKFANGDCKNTICKVENVNVAGIRVTDIEAEYGYFLISLMTSDGCGSGYCNVSLIGVGPDDIRYLFDFPKHSEVADLSAALTKLRSLGSFAYFDPIEIPVGMKLEWKSQGTYQMCSNVGSPLSGVDVHALLAGNRVYGRVISNEAYTNTYATDGVGFGSVHGRKSSFQWKIVGNTVCYGNGICMHVAPCLSDYGKYVRILPDGIQFSRIEEIIEGVFHP